MTKLQYTGTNFAEVKALCGNSVLAPYECMGITMLISSLSSLAERVSLSGHT